MARLADNDDTRGNTFIRMTQKTVDQWSTATRAGETCHAMRSYVVQQHEQTKNRLDAITGRKRLSYVWAV